MELAWYTYFSWWVFIWFIIFKLGFTKLSPYLIYVFIVVFILFKFLRDLIYITFYDEKEIKNYESILIWVLNVIILDLIPPFYLERQIDSESIFFTLLLALVYCSLMNKWNYNIIKHYTIMNYREISDRFTTKSFIEGVLKVNFNY